MRNNNSHSKLPSRGSNTMRSSFTPALREDLQQLIKAQKKEHDNAWHAINCFNKSSATSVKTTAHCTPLNNSIQITPPSFTSGQTSRQSSNQLNTMSYEQLTLHLRDVSLVLEKRLSRDDLNGTSCRSGSDQDVITVASTEAATSTDPSTHSRCLSSKSERAYNSLTSIECQVIGHEDDIGVADQDEDDEESGSAVECSGSDLSHGSCKRLRSMSVGNESNRIGRLRPSFVRCEREEPEEPELLSIPMMVSSGMNITQPHLHIFTSGDETKADKYVQSQTPSETQSIASSVTRAETQTPLPWTTSASPHNSGRDATSLAFPTPVVTRLTSMPFTRDHSLDLTLHSISTSRSNSTSGFDFDGPYSSLSNMPLMDSPVSHCYNQSHPHIICLPAYAYSSDSVWTAAPGSSPHARYAQVSPSSRACQLNILDGAVVGAGKGRWTHSNSSGSAFVDIFNLNISPTSQPSLQPAGRTNTQMSVTGESTFISINTTCDATPVESIPPPQFPQVFSPLRQTFSLSKSSSDGFASCTH